jgi:hypothetical protein
MGVGAQRDPCTATNYHLHIVSVNIYGHVYGIPITINLNGL